MRKLMTKKNNPSTIFLTRFLKIYNLPFQSYHSYATEELPKTEEKMLMFQRLFSIEPGKKFSLKKGNEYSIHMK